MQVSLADSQSLRGGGIVFVADLKRSAGEGRPSDVQAGWKSQRTLMIRYAGARLRIFQEAHQWKDVGIAFADQDTRP
jgi:hypothetical protein